jgi:3-deoxy-D-manno-octulosonic-acid transferase
MFAYNLALNLLLVILSPFILVFVALNSKFRNGIGERLGMLSSGAFDKIRGKKIIWFHAASVGETQALIPVINEIKKINSGYDIIATTTSVNGRNKLQKDLEGVILHACLLPADLDFIVAGFVRKVSPKMVVIVETELWPNLVSCLYKNRVPVVMINGRISIKSFRFYRLFKFFFRGILDKFSVLVMQSEKMVVRLRLMGIDKQKMIMVRNTKYSNAESEKKGRKIEIPAKSGRKIVVAGSIRKGEEATVIGGFKRSIYGKACLIIAPRHLDRVRAVEETLDAEGLTHVRWTEVLDYKAVLFYDSIVVNTIGELQYIYKICDMAVIGGGFKPFGGHNPMEAAINAKPVIMGKNMFNFEDTSTRFVKAGGAFMIDDSADEMAEKLKFLFDNPDRASEMGKKCLEAIDAFRGSAATTALIINEVLLDSEKHRGIAQ